MLPQSSVQDTDPLEERWIWVILKKIPAKRTTLRGCITPKMKCVEDRLQTLRGENYREETP